jgi:hypothetical protein
LEIYLGDGRIEIDNNLGENVIRPTAIGKKNWLFIGDGQAGERSAILYTVIESCRRRGIDPYGYLRDVLTRLPRMTNWQIPEVTPQAWAKAQRVLPRFIASYTSDISRSDVYDSSQFLCQRVLAVTLTSEGTTSYARRAVGGKSWRHEGNLVPDLPSNQNLTKPAAPTGGRV